VWAGRLVAHRHASSNASSAESTGTTNGTIWNIVKWLLSRSTVRLSLLSWRRSIAVGARQGSMIVVGLIEAETSRVTIGI
jgi:hypothetical protein